MKRIAGVVALAAVLAACAAGTQTSEPVPGMASDSAAIAPEGVPPGQPAAQVITTGYLSILADDPVDAANQAKAIAIAASGQVDQESENRFDERVTMNLTLRIPATSFVSVIDDIGALGTIESKQVSRVDVTTQVLDLDARIAALETSVARMTELLGEAETVGDLIAAEAALAERQGQLDSLISQRDYLRDQVDLSTINVSIASSSASSLTPVWSVAGGILVGILIGIVIGFIVRKRQREQ